VWTKINGTDAVLRIVFAAIFVEFAYKNSVKIFVSVTCPAAVVYQTQIGALSLCWNVH